MTTLQTYPVLIKIVAILGLFLPQIPANNTPMAKDGVVRLWNNLKTVPDRPGLMREEIGRVGLDFPIDAKTEREFRDLGMDSSLIEFMKRNVKIAGITIECQPVECEVRINEELVGTTVSNLFRKSPITPGRMTIKVSAPPGYGSLTADVTVQPGQQLSVPKFTLPLLSGELALSCQPAECGITVKGQNNGIVKSGTTSNHRFSVQGLELGPYDVVFNAPPDYFPKTETVWISSPTVHTLDVRLERDPWGPLTPLQVLDAIVGSLGGTEIKDWKYLKNEAVMSLAGDPSSIGNWNAIRVTELVAPNRLRWDMLIAGSKWSVFYDGTKAGSRGDKKTVASGTEFGQELEHSILSFSAMRLPLVLATILSKFDIKKGPRFVLIADSPDDRYTFQLSEEFVPQKILHEHLTVPRSREEVEFAQYKSVGQDLKLPHVMILRYPDRPKHEHVFNYSKMEQSTQMKEEQFKR